MSRRSVASIGLSASLLLVSASWSCTLLVGADARGRSCAADADCDPGLRCDEGVCLKGDRCRGGCPAGWSCDEETSSCRSLSWARSIGGLDEDQIDAVALDRSGGSFVCGSFRSASLEVGSSVYENTSEEDFGGQRRTDAFLARLDEEDGAPVWSRALAGPSTDACRALATLKDEATLAETLFLAATSEGELDLQSPSGAPLAPAGFEDIVLARLDPDDGALLWTLRFGGPFADLAAGIATDSSGHLWMLGSSSSDPLDLGGGPMAGRGGLDLVVGRYHADATIATHLFSLRRGGPGFDEGRAIAVATGDGFPDEIFVVGALGGPGVDLGGGPLSEGGAFLWVFTEEGEHLASRAFGSGALTAVDVSASGDVYVGGETQAAEIDLGGGPIPNPGNGIGLLARVTKQGEHVFSIAIGEASFNTVTAVRADGEGVLVAGRVQAPASLGPFTLEEGGFVARFDRDGAPVWAVSTSGDPRSLDVRGGSGVIGGAHLEAMSWPGGTLEHRAPGNADGFVLRVAP